MIDLLANEYGEPIDEEGNVISLAEIKPTHYDGKSLLVFDTQDEYDEYIEKVLTEK